MAGLQVGLYQLTSALGSGAYGSVWECRHIQTQELFACKIVETRTCLDPEFLRHFENELNVQSKVQHPGIIQLRDVVSDEDNIYLVLELCKAGDLNTLVQESNGLPEDDVRHYFYQIMSAISYLHGLGVAHRDIKLENILITEDDNAKLSDFGLCKESGVDSRMMTTCGTLLYAAPEVIQEQPYSGLKADVWSAGVALYTMLAGHFPWVTDETLPDDRLVGETVRQICDGNVEMPEGISFQLDNLLSNMLDVDPETRPTAAEVLDHPWFAEEAAAAPIGGGEPDRALVEKVESLIATLRKAGKK